MCLSGNRNLKWFQCYFGHSIWDCREAQPSTWACVIVSAPRLLPLIFPDFKSILGVRRFYFNLETISPKWLFGWFLEYGWNGHFAMNRMIRWQVSNGFFTYFWSNLSLPPCLHSLSLIMIATFGLLFPVSSHASFRDCGCGGNTFFFGHKGFYSSRLAARSAHTQRIGRRKSSGPTWPNQKPTGSNLAVLGFRIGPNMSPFGSNLGVTGSNLANLSPTWGPTWAWHAKLGWVWGDWCRSWAQDKPYVMRWYVTPLPTPPFPAYYF
jgi:hypothetical protein